MKKEILFLLALFFIQASCSDDERVVRRKIDDEVDLMREPQIDFADGWIGIFYLLHVVKWSGGKSKLKSI